MRAGDEEAERDERVGGDRRDEQEQVEAVGEVGEQKVARGEEGSEQGRAVEGEAVVALAAAELFGRVSADSC